MQPIPKKLLESKFLSLYREFTSSSAPTGVGAILRFFVCRSSPSASCIVPDSRFDTPPAVVAGMLEADIGVIGGVDSGKLPEPEFVAVTPGTVPIVGVGELPIIPAVGGAKDDCVATDDTEFDRDLVGLAEGLCGFGDAKVFPVELGILENDGALEPVGVGMGDGWAELFVPIDKE